MVTGLFRRTSLEEPQREQHRRVDRSTKAEIVRAVDAGATWGAVAAEFEVSRASVARFVREARSVRTERQTVSEEREQQHLIEAIRRQEERASNWQRFKRTVLRTKGEQRGERERQQDQQPARELSPEELIDQAARRLLAERIAAGDPAIIAAIDRRIEEILNPRGPVDRALRDMTDAERLRRALSPARPPWWERLIEDVAARLAPPPPPAA